MANSWIDCTGCGNRFSSFMQSCPRCGAANPNHNLNSNASSSPSPDLYRKTGSRNSIKVAMGILIGIAIFAAVIFSWLMFPGWSNFFAVTPAPHTIPFAPSAPNVVSNQASSDLTLDQLVQHALLKINQDRAKYGLPPVNLSPNRAAQAHAEDMLSSRQISHWTTDGMKPYMRYTIYNGTGAVQQNVYEEGFEGAEYDQCVSGMLFCTKVDPYKAIDDGEWMFMYNDSACCNNGHRDNILEKSHTDVSIGIAYNDYYFALVQNFENNYIKFDRPITEDYQGKNTRTMHISGSITAGTILAVDVFYDQWPSPQVYQENKDRTSYDQGRLVAVVEKPLPIGFYYNRPSNYTLTVADRWVQDGQHADISFDLGRIMQTEGVYTLYTIVEDSQKDKFQVTSYSLFVKNA